MDSSSRVSVIFYRGYSVMVKVFARDRKVPGSIPTPFKSLLALGQVAKSEIASSPIPAVVPPLLCISITKILDTVTTVIITKSVLTRKTLPLCMWHSKID